MPVKLKDRDGVYYAMGTMTLPSGAKLEVRQSTGFTVKQRAFAEQRLAAIIKEKIEAEAAVTAGRPDMTVAEAAVKYLASRKMSPTTHEFVNQLVKAHGSALCGAMDKVKLRAWADKPLARKPLSQGTVRRRLAAAQALLNYVHEHYGVSVAQTKIKKPSDNEGRDRWLDVAQRDRLIGAFKVSVYRDLVTFLFFTGARLGEARALKVEDVTPEGVVLRSRKGKGGKMRTRVVPLHPDLRSLLEERVRGLARGALVFQMDGQQVKDDAFRRNFASVCAAEGIEDFLPHDCRHTFATLLAKTGEVDLQELAQLLGHENIQMTMRYRHLLPRRQVIGIANLGVIRTQGAQLGDAVQHEEANYLVLSVA